MDFLQKCLYGVFELPLPRNAQKRTKNKCQEKMHLGLVGSSEFNQIYVKVGRFSFEGLALGGYSLPGDQGLGKRNR
jgi:hypothetical protein